MTGETPATSLPLPTKVWTHHILPLLPLKTVLNVTTLLNKKTSKDFEKYENEFWYNYLKHEHFYLLGIRTACEYYYEDTKAMSWTTYAKSCFSRKFPQKNYAMMLGHCHATIHGSRYDLISQALVRLRQLKNEIGPKHFEKFFDLETGLLKFDDVFNAFAVFLDMFDPAFAALYTEAMTLLNAVTLRLQTEMKNLPNSSIPHLNKCVCTVTIFLQIFFKKSTGLTEGSEFPETYLNGVLRSICCAEFHNNDINILFVIFIELMRRLGYTVDVSKSCGTPTSNPEAYLFSFKESKHGFYGLTLFKGKELKSIYQECDQDCTFDDLVKHVQAKQNSRDCWLPKIKVPLMLEYHIRNILFMDLFLPTTYFENVIKEDPYFIFSLKFPYGMNVLPKKPEFKILLRTIKFYPEQCRAHGQFAWSLQNMVVVVGLDTESHKCCCVNMMNTLFLEELDNLILPDHPAYPLNLNLEPDPEATKVLHRIFKYNTMIGLFFRSYENRQFTDFLL